MMIMQSEFYSQFSYLSRKKILQPPKTFYFVKILIIIFPRTTIIYTTTATIITIFNIDVTRLLYISFILLSLTNQFFSFYISFHFFSAFWFVADDGFDSVSIREGGEFFHSFIHSLHFISFQIPYTIFINIKFVGIDNGHDYSRKIGKNNNHDMNIQLLLFIYVK